MCILFFIVNENAKDNEYKLILASNRDEFYARPALAAHHWKEDESVIGGMDMEAGREGGTWLAISTKKNTFKFSALLNITGEIKDENALPRGNIISDYVKSSMSNTQYCQYLVETGKKFNHFNLITIQISDQVTKSVYYCNVNNTMTDIPLNKSVGFGNSLIRVPLKKVEAGKDKFHKIVDRPSQTKNELIESLFGLLCDPERHWPDAELQRRRPEWADQLCTICVKMPEVGYGSRTRTVILVDANNKVDFYEETMTSTDPEGKWSRTHIESEF